MMTLEPHGNGWVIPVRAQPGAKRNVLQGCQAGALKVAVTAPPEDGRANKALTDLLRDSLRLKRSQITLLSGATSRVKKFLVTGLSQEELWDRLQPWIGPSDSTE